MGFIEGGSNLPTDVARSFTTTTGEPASALLVFKKNGNAGGNEPIKPRIESIIDGMPSIVVLQE